MMPLVVGPDATLTEVLSVRARAAAPSRLFLDIFGGGAVAAVSAWAQPSGWFVLFLTALCFLAYGLWAFAERHLADQTQPPAHSAWHILWDFAALLGLASFVLLLFALLGVGLGSLVS